MEALKEARKRAKLTQTELARRLGYPQSYISKYENAERRLDVLEYVRVAAAIGIDPCQPLREVTRLVTPVSRKRRGRGSSKE